MGSERERERDKEESCLRHEEKAVAFAVSGAGQQMREMFGGGR